LEPPPVKVSTRSKPFGGERLGMFESAAPELPSRKAAGSGPVTVTLTPSLCDFRFDLRDEIAAGRVGTWRSIRLPQRSRSGACRL
jgi:hypothetical protein